MDLSIDASELRALAVDLGNVSAKVAKGARDVISKGALNVKNDWNDAFKGSRHFGHIGGAVSYDVTVTGSGVEAEVGVDRDRRPGAPLAGIAHFGGARGGGGSIADPQTFLDAEAPALEKYLSEIVEGLL